MYLGAHARWAGAAPIREAALVAQRMRPFRGRLVRGKRHDDVREPRTRHVESAHTVFVPAGDHGFRVASLRRGASNAGNLPRLTPRATSHVQVPRLTRLLRPPGRACPSFLRARKEQPTKLTDRRSGLLHWRGGDKRE